MFIDFGVKKSQYLRDILGLDNPESHCSFYSFCYVSESFLVSVTWRYSPVCFRAQLCTLKLFLCRIFYPAFIMFGMTSDFASLIYPLKVKVKSLSHVQLFATLDCSLSGSSVHGIFQARVEINVVFFVFVDILTLWTSLVAQWMRIHQPMQGT